MKTGLTIIFTVIGILLWPLLIIAEILITICIFIAKPLFKWIDNTSDFIEFILKDSGTKGGR
jgi:hypothetical protein